MFNFLTDSLAPRANVHSGRPPGRIAFRGSIAPRLLVALHFVLAFAPLTNTQRVAERQLRQRNRLPRYLDFNFSDANGLCGSWASDYAALHRLILERASNAYVAWQKADGIQQPVRRAGQREGEMQKSEDTDDGKAEAEAEAEEEAEEGGEEEGEEDRPSRFYARDPSIRFLTFEWLDGCGGFADVLAGLVTAFVVALLDNRALIIRNRCLPAAFEPNMINWQPAPFVPLEPARNLSFVDRGWRTIPQRARDGEVVLVWLRNKFVKIEPFFRPLEGAVNVRMTSNRGVLTWLQTRARGKWAARFTAMGMRLPYALGCSLRFLMRPKPEVQALYRSIEWRLRRRSWAGGAGMRRRRVATVGIHVRVRDEVVWAGDRGAPKELNDTQVDVLLARARRWLQCARRVEAYWFPSSVAVRWMLVTNSVQLKAAITSQFPHKVITTDFIPRHSNSLSSSSAGSSGNAFSTLSLGELERQQQEEAKLEQERMFQELLILLFNR
ncbi:unnamed protein product [Closterium sp. Naga37s-1]|nr:unnamed protein product [Closterium sp. Naga37s-1]